MTSEVLDVFLHDKLAGQLTYEAGLMSFSYNNNYLGTKHSFALSASLPLQTEFFDHQASSSFFSGLLPESIVRTRIARYLQISEQNTFALLKEIGGECAGAVSLYPKGNGPNTEFGNTYRILEDEEAHNILSQLDKRPLMVGEDDIRISGAGAQDKLIVAFSGDKLAIPMCNTPSTHIIKPKIHDLDETVQNEFFCMTLAKKVGLPVPNVKIFHLKDEAYYLIERYDRLKNNDGNVSRLHQEDMCQALQIPPEQKYENEGGPTFKDCFDLLDQHIQDGRMAGVNRLILLQGVIFNFLIGNGDAHAKNFSILHRGEAETLAPFYDLLCTLVYGNAYKSKMAMKLGGQYKFRDIDISHFKRLGEEARFKPSFIDAQAKKLMMSISKEAPILVDELNANAKTASPIYKKILTVIETNCHQISHTSIS